MIHRHWWYFSSARNFLPLCFLISERIFLLLAFFFCSYLSGFVFFWVAASGQPLSTCKRSAAASLKAGNRCIVLPTSGQPLFYTIAAHERATAFLQPLSTPSPLSGQPLSTTAFYIAIARPPCQQQEDPSDLHSELSRVLPSITTSMGAYLHLALYSFKSFKGSVVFKEIQSQVEV